VADDAFYAPLLAYMMAVRAPSEAIAAITYSRALASWDWPRVIVAGDTLTRAYLTGVDWVPADMLRDGVVVAQLRLGDPIAARRTAAMLARFSARDPESLRSMLLESYLVAEEQARATAMRQPRSSVPLPAPGQRSGEAAPKGRVSVATPAAVERRTASGRTP
jgi:hypothetical protein